MQPLSGSVGAGGTNAVHDVALVQAILLKTTRPASADGRRPAAPYLASYDGTYGNATLLAIQAFQTDNPPPRPPAARATAAALPSGLIAPGDATWAALLLHVPAAFADMRVLPQGRTVYVAATAAQLQAKLALVAAMTFNGTFRTNAVACINRVHALHGIAMGVVPGTGDRRTFQTQYDLATSGRGVTGAGPGESNHNFGQAADFSFFGLRWLHADGTVVANETASLHRLDPAQRGATPEARLFWTTFQGIGTGLGLHRGPAGDQPHLQAWNDATVYMPTRLADLLQRSGTMRWQKVRGAPYQCDFGLGGALYPVSTAVNLWSSNATVTAAQLTAARTAAALAAARRAGPRAVAAAVAPANAADVRAMQTALRGQMELADANWQNWRP